MHEKLELTNMTRLAPCPSQAALKDYGFQCQCSLCLREKERALAGKKPARGGVKMGRKG